MEKKQKNEKAIYIIPIELESALDLGRRAYSLSHNSRNIYRLKINGEYSLCMLGGFVGETRMAYYIHSEETGKYASYTPKDERGSESFRVSDSPASSSDMGVYRITIIDIDEKQFKIKNPKEGDILYVKARESEDIVRGVIINSVESENLGLIYSFKYDGKAFVGSFEIIGDDKKIFVYAEDNSESPEKAFYVYDYASNMIKKARSFSENSYIYVRIINLASPIPGFKP